MHSSSKIPPEVLADGLFRLQFPAMGTHCKILFTANSMVAADIFRKNALDWVHRFEARYSRFRDDSLICRINDAAGRNPVVIDEVDIHLFDLCETLHFLTEGLFDPTTLPLSRLWDFKAENPQIPSKSAISEALSKIGWKKVHRENHSIFLPETGMGLDFGGFGKEYAVDRVTELAREHGLEDFLIDFGGDVFAEGSPPDATAWRVGLEDPGKQGQAKRIFSVSGMAVATSGNYRRFFEKNGKRYGHLIDHRTGFPTSNNCLSATVISRSCLEAGVLSTCALLDGTDRGLARIDRFFGAEGCIQNRNGVEWTKGIYEYLHDTRN
ncbi:MAG: FAD:protein FMN transferase [Verrucomicrobia bacterium]|nr:FAD:protein FMN transferase [Verrucomicrobiota bacterium]